MVNLIALAIPFFFLGIGLELAIAWKKRRSGLYRMADAFSDLGCGIGQQLVTGFWGAGLLSVYDWLYTHGRLVTLPGWAGWVVAVVGVDFLYYWWHRLSHEVNFLWAAHVVHHQSEDYNLAVALRQSITTSLTSFPFYAVLAFVGVPTLAFAIAAAVNTLYQFWIHTELVPALGPVEWVLNTPAQHRVHHAINPQYLDKNHGGTFSIWDRLFGTFQPEKEACVYGITRPHQSFNPLWAQVSGYLDVWRLARTAPSLTEGLKAFFKSPAWHPEWLETPAKMQRQHKYDVDPPLGVKRYAFAQFSLVAVGTFCFLMWGQNALGFWPKVGCVGVLLLALLSINGLLEGKTWARPLEAVRWVATLAVAIGVLR